MDPSVFFNIFWPIASAVIVALTHWIKKNLPGDWPVEGAVISAALNFLSIFLLNQAFGMGLTLNEMVPYMVGGYAASTAAHAVWKTKKKNLMGGGE